MTTIAHVDMQEKMAETSGIHVTAEAAVLEEPSFAANKALIRKIDRHLIPPLAMLYVICYIDRASLGNASIFGYKESIHIDTTQYNLIVTVFYFSYCFFEYPSQMIIPYCRPSYWLAGLTFAWGVCTTLSGLTQNFAGALAARFFVGVCESGFFPGAMWLVSMWYPRDMLSSRVAAFYTFGVFAGSFAGLLAYAINFMDGVGGLRSWRWIFILEGIGTCVAAIPVLFVPDHPQNCKWLTEEEKDMCEAHRLAAGNSKAAHHFEWRFLKQALLDPKVWMATWLASAGDIAVFGFSYTLPTILVQMGFEAATAQLMTIPFYALSAALAFGCALLSDQIKMRGPIVLVGYSVTTIGLIALDSLPKEGSVGVRYFFAIWVLAGVYLCFPSVLSWCSNNAAGIGKKNMAMTIQLSLANLFTTIGTNTYLGREAPYYKTGFAVGITGMASAVVTAAALMLLIKRENDAKAKVDVSRFTAEQLEEMGDKAPTFKYIM